MTHTDDGIIVSVPLTIKRRNGRKEIIVPDASSSNAFLPANHQEALVIALARAYRWKRLLDEGKFESITQLAEAVGLDVSFTARLLRLTLLAPDIVEAILMGKEPDGLSLTRLTKIRSVVWEDQRRVLNTVEDVLERTCHSCPSNSANDMTSTADNTDGGHPSEILL